MLETQPSSHFMKTLASHPRRTNILSEWPCTLVTSAPLQMRASKPCRAELLCRRFDLIVSAKEASMSGGRFLCRTRLNTVLPPYSH